MDKGDDDQKVNQIPSGGTLAIGFRAASWARGSRLKTELSNKQTVKASTKWSQEPGKRTTCRSMPH